MSTDIRIDPVKCTGHGLCALLLPDQVALDRWGFPVVSGSVEGRRGRRRARRAERACPRRALIVDDQSPASPRTTVKQ